MGKLIYIADDEKNIRELIQHFLMKEGLHMKIISEYNHNKHFHYYLTDNETGTKTYYCNRTEVKPMTKVTVIEQTVHMELEKSRYFTWKDNETAYTNKKGDFKEIYNDIPDLSKVKYNVIIQNIDL